MGTIGDFLDANWISNILSISFTLVVFLLGVPIVFIQTYVPENLRKYYVIKQKKQIVLLNICIAILIINTIFFGNQGFKYLLINININDMPFSLNENIKSLISLISRNSILKAYYFISLIFFIFTILLVYKIFGRIVFRKEDIKVEIINDVFKDLRISCDTYLSSDLEEECKKITNIFIDFSYIFRSNYERVIFVEQIIQLIDYVRSHKNYTGKEIKELFGQLLEFIYIKDFDECTKVEIETFLDLCNKISVIDTKDSADYEYFTEIFLFALYKKLIDSNYIKLAQYVIVTMKKFNISQSVLFRVYYYAYENKLYKQLFIEIAFIVKNYLKGYSDSGINKVPDRNNLVAYLSLLYNHNQLSKGFIVKRLKDINMRLKDRKITFSDFENAQLNFTEEYRLDTAQKISEMKTGYFKLKTTNK